MRCTRIATKSIDDRVTGNVDLYAKQATVIHLEIDLSEVDKIVKSDIAVLGNVAKTLPLLTELVVKRDHAAWVHEFTKLHEVEREAVIEADLYPEKPGITPGEVIRRINAATRDDAIVVTDVGQHQMFASRYCRHKRTRSFITSGGLGTMGFGLPAALGAQIGAPDRDVICIVGDGGIQMTIHELGTLRQTGAAVKIVLFNNSYLGMVRQWQELFFDRRYSETHLENPDFVKVAEGYRIPARKVSVRAELDQAILEMMRCDGPYLLEVTVDKEENVFPMVPSSASVSDVMLKREKG